ncbi:alpha/beta hydrolase family protein [Erythrobacter sp. HA6-11]
MILKFGKAAAAAGLAIAIGILPSEPSFAQDQATVVEPAPLSAYGELPEVEEAALSPSGNRIAALITLRGKRILVFFENETTVLQTVNVDDHKIRGFEWIGEDRLLLVMSSTQRLGFNFTTDKHEFYFGMVVPVDPNHKGGVVFANKRKLANAFFGEHGIRQIDGRWYGFFGAVELRKYGNSGYQFEHGRPFLYKVDLMDLSAERMDFSAREGEYKDWLIDADGEIAVTYLQNRQSGAWKIRNSGGDVIAEGRRNTGRSGLIGLGKDGASVIYYERNDAGFNKWYQVPLAGGPSVPYLDDVDVQRLYFEQATGHMIGYLTDDENPQPVFDDPAHAEAVKKVRRAFSKSDMRMINWTDDLSKMIVRTSGNFDSGSWFTVDVDNLSAKAFAYERGSIRPDQVGAISTFSYTASDGLEMDGVLTLPPGKEAKDLPVVMLPHGGPHAYDREQFHWWAQAFASRGYAVFQPNFRGSTNRSGAFRKAGYGEWGRKMQTDISDGLAALAEAGIVDPSRACIVGASYGGYAALAGVTIQQGLYRCSVAVAPVSDIGRMYKEDYRASAGQRTTKAALLEQLGPKDRWDEVSPHRHAHLADAPILLIHGKDDTVVPYIHSTKMADALKDARKPHELITLEGEDHWLSKSETRRKMLEAAVGFVEKHNPPG